MVERTYKALGRLDFRPPFLLAPSALRGLRLPSSRSLPSVARVTPGNHAARFASLRSAAVLAGSGFVESVSPFESARGGG